MKKLIRLVEEKTAFLQTVKGEKKTIDYENDQELTSLKNNQDIKSIETGDGKKIKEEVGRKYTTQESIAVGKAVVRPLIAALKSVGSEFKEDSKAKVNSKRANTFEIRVTYAKDAGEGVFEFEINPNGAKNELSIKTPDNKFEIIADDVTVPTGGTGRAAVGAEQQLIDKLVDSTAIQKFTSEPSNSDLEETTKRVGGKYVNYPEKGGKRLGTFDTKSAAQKQLAAIEINKHKNEALDPVGQEDEDIDNNNKVDSTDKYLLNRRRAITKNMKEDLDLGHQDDEPGMLLGDLYSIMKSTKELYEMVSQFEGQQEVDFPHWWQAKIINANLVL